MPGSATHVLLRTPAVVLIVLAVWAAVYLPALGTTGIKGEEFRRILPARAMQQSGEWVLPYSEGRPYHRKPPLINWAIAGSFALCGGESTFAARLPSALAALLLGLTGVWAGGKFIGAATGPAARYFPLMLPLMLLTCLGMVEKGRLAEIESLYCALFGMGFLVWAVRWREDSSVLRRWLVPSIFFALAMLAKGPVFLPFFYVIVLITLWKSGRLCELWHPAHLTSLVMMAVPFILWGVLANARVVSVVEGVIPRGQSAVWVQQIFGRLLPDRMDWMNWAASPFFTLMMLSPPALVAGIQWVRLRRGPLRSAPQRDRALLSGLAAGSLLIGLVFALLPSPEPRYQLPLAAPVCLLAVWLVALEPASEVPPAPWPLLSLGMSLALLTLNIAGSVSPLIRSLNVPMMALPWITGGAVVAWMAMIALRRMALPHRFIGETAVVAAYGVLFFATVATPARRSSDDIRPVAVNILTAAGPDVRIAAYLAGPQPFLYYLGPQTVECASLGQIPPDATHVVLPEDKWADERSRGQFEFRGFTTEKLRFIDNASKPQAEQKRFVLVARTR